MKTITFHLFFTLLVILYGSSCEQPAPKPPLSPTTLPEDTTAVLPTTSPTSSANLKAEWNQIAGKLPLLSLPSKITCNGIKDSLQFELSEPQFLPFLPKEIFRQKNPVVSSLYNLRFKKDTIGIVYHIYYPVVYDKLNDIRSQLILVLYNPNGQYTDYRTLAIQEYGNGYTHFKSLQEIIYLYTVESETPETKITIYDLSDKVSFKTINSIHLASRGSQREYDRNTFLIEKLME
jgi:hypothetical protein